jgi:hypothetical protein
MATNLLTLIQKHWKQHTGPMNNTGCSVTITLTQHHHQNYAAGTGHKSAFTPIIITWQQDPALRLPNFTHHHITTLDLAKLKLGQQGQAIRLSKALGKPSFGITVGKP